jgi:uncharacterized membrane protein YfhO
MIMKFKFGVPRYNLVSDWIFTSDDAVCAKLADPRFSLHKQVLISSDMAEALPEKNAGSDLNSSPGILQVESSSAKKVVIKASATTPCVLVVSQKYEPGWTAEVNGRPVDVLRCNYVCQGVFLENGEHEVVLKYSTGILCLWIQIFGMFVCLLAGAGLLIRRIASHEAESRRVDALQDG